MLETWTHFALGNYLMGTALAVESALLHNFGWHCVYTWRDRPAKNRRAAVWRALRLHLSNGAVSLLGNLLMMRFLVDAVGLPFLVANSIAIMACSVINFALGNRFVFGDTG